MRRGKTVKDIIRPPVAGLSTAPVIGMDEPLTLAIEMMLNNDKKEITVVGRHGVIGYVCLEDALRHMGLRV